MCFARRASAPQIISQGPSQEDIDRQNQALQVYQQQIAAQQKAMADQLQQQIDRANAEAQRQREQLAADQAATVARQQSTYTVTAAQSEPPAAAMTTTAAKPKEKPRAGLRIAPGSTPAGSGAGLNIGI
jgi:septal ring factor EnvC (AmiA/AmiB activator)